MSATQSSPEQIAGRLKRTQNISLHHEAIYRYILKDRRDGGELYLHLRRKQKVYKKRYGSSTNSTKGIPKPYHSWERGQNENANGLLRQYFPKGMKFTDIARKEVVEAVHKLNSRPRKCLDYALLMRLLWSLQVWML